jgi:hypothetical protein
VRFKETNASEPLMTCRNSWIDVKTGRSSSSRDQAGGKPAYCPVGIRHEGGVTLNQALLWNVGTCRPDAKGEPQVGSPHEGESTEAGHRDGATRSRDEGSVMELDRRGCIVSPCLGVNQQWEELRG